MIFSVYLISKPWSTYITNVKNIVRVKRTIYHEIYVMPYIISPSKLWSLLAAVLASKNGHKHEHPDSRVVSKIFLLQLISIVFFCMGILLGKGISSATFITKQPGLLRIVFKTSHKTFIISYYSALQHEIDTFRDTICKSKVGENGR